MARIVARGGEAPRFRASRVGGTLEVSHAFPGDSASMATRSRDLTLFGLLHSRCAFGIALALSASDRRHPGCGCSSVVEHDLAKVGVEGSSPFARSKNFWYLNYFRWAAARRPTRFWLRGSLRGSGERNGSLACAVISR